MGGVARSLKAGKVSEYIMKRRFSLQAQLCYNWHMFWFLASSWPARAPPIDDKGSGGEEDMTTGSSPSLKVRLYMDKHQRKDDSFDIPDDLEETAKYIIRRAFKLFEEQTTQLVKNLAEFNRKRKEIQKDIQDGTRRTRGRII
jgi:hypothetical protein